MTVSALQVVAIVLVSLVAGSTFGVWRGFNPAGFSAQAFLEMHQGAVRGLNVLLPAMALGAILITLCLAIISRRNRIALALYVLAALVLAVAGIITRFENQPINAEVMGWTLNTMPADWEAIRDRWWTWHVARTLVSIVGEIVLIIAVFMHRDERVAVQR